MNVALITALLAAAPILDDPPPQPQSPSSSDVALVVGVSDYAFITDVPFADRDAKAFADYLVRGRGVPPDRIRLLLDGNAVKENIEEGLRFVQERAQTDSTIWIYFAGHGVPSTTGDDGLLVGADVQQTLRSFQARGVSRKWLLQQLGQSRAAKAVALLDACFSGKSREGNALLAGLRPLVAVRQPEDASPRVLVFSAASADETSGPFDRVRQGLFSYFAIGGLRGWADQNRDGVVTADELSGYIRRGVGTVLSDGTRSQTPNTNADPGDPRLGWPLAGQVREVGPDLAGLSPQMRSASVSVAGGAQLSEVPELSGNLKAGGAINLDTDPDVLVAYDAALRADAKGREDPLGAAKAWQKVYGFEKNNPYRADAAARAREWQTFHDRSQGLATQQAADTERLKKVLPLESVNVNQKLQLLAAYEQLYGRKSAAGLLDAATGRDRDFLCSRYMDAVPLSNVFVDMPYADEGKLRGTAFVYGRMAGAVPGNIPVPSCAMGIYVRAAGGQAWQGAIPADHSSIQPQFANLRGSYGGSVAVGYGNEVARKAAWQRERPGIGWAIGGYTLGVTSAAFVLGAIGGLASENNVSADEAVGYATLFGLGTLAGLGTYALLHHYYAYPDEPPADWSAPGGSPNAPKAATPPAPAVTTPPAPTESSY